MRKLVKPLVLIIAVAGMLVFLFSERIMDWLWHLEVSETVLQHQISPDSGFEVVRIHRSESDFGIVRYTNRKSGTKLEYSLPYMPVGDVDFTRHGSLYKIYITQSGNRGDLVGFIDTQSNKVHTFWEPEGADLKELNRVFTKEISQQSASADSASAEPAGP